MTSIDRKLTHVNQLLAKLGFNAVPTLGTGTSKAASLASGLLDEGARLLQEEGWHFGIETDVEITPSALGYIYLPNDVLHVDAVDKSCNLVMRDQRLYNLTDRTFDFDIPTNLLTSPNDLTDAAWVKTNTAVTANSSRSRGPHDGPNTTNQIIDNAGAAALADTTQDLATDLTAGTTYEVSLYARAGRNLSVPMGRFEIQKDGTAVAAGRWLGNVEPPTGHFLSDTNIADLEAFDAEMILLDKPSDFLAAGGASDDPVDASWVYMRFKYTATAGATTWSYMLQPDGSLATLAGPEMYVTGAQVTEVGSNATKFNVVRCLPFIDLPDVARSYVAAEALVSLNDALLGAPDLGRRFQALALKAHANLMSEDIRSSDANQVWDSYSTSRVLGQGYRRSALGRSLGIGSLNNGAFNNTL